MLFFLRFAARPALPSFLPLGLVVIISKKVPTKITAEEHCGDAETRWTDAQIRWPDEEIDNSNNDDDESENGAPIDPFQDPDPFDTFAFRFPHPSSTTSITTAGEEADDSNNNNNAFIDIALRGYKAESDQIWQSTGLTLWRAAQHLCEYLVNHVELLQNKRILEVSEQEAHHLCTTEYSLFIQKLQGGLESLFLKIMLYSCIAAWCRLGSLWYFGTSYDVVLVQ
jgi:hypothetical protein